jgi:MFS family permease|tara:strand:- start:942 stop:2237 length:1296 start_codon:yes stop_codon:yes gene_type:complete
VKIKQNRYQLVDSKTPFFYGWIIVLGAFLGSFAGGGMQSFTFGVFLKPMSEDLGWSRSTLIGALTLRTFVTAGLAPFLGKYVDSKGPQLIMVSSSIAGGIACLLLTQINTIWQFYLAFILVGLAGGAGMGGVVANATVLKWFIKYRGRATAFSTMGNTAAGAILAPAVGFVILSSNWRMGWIVIAIIFFFFLFPVSTLMVRKPEDIGLLPDGAKNQSEIESNLSKNNKNITDKSWTLSEALKTNTLWILTFSMLIGGIGVASVVVHEFSYITDLGFSTSIAALILSVHAVTASFGRLVWGFLVEKIEVKYCMAILYIGCAFGLAILQFFATSVFMLLLFAVIYGICVGGHIVLSNVAWADYYGREFVGSIRGFLTPFTTGASALGPIVIGLAYDLTKTYTQAFNGLLVMFLLGTFVILLAKSPDKMSHPSK